MGKIGTHIIVDLFNCGFGVLNNSEALKALLVMAAEEAGCTVLGAYVHTFSPQGVTAVVILAESHVSVHTYPERGYAALDIFTCGDKAMPMKAMALLIDKLKPGFYNFKTMERG
jgi:S-adenosylmethionine decarboxylase